MITYDTNIFSKYKKINCNNINYMHTYYEFLLVVKLFFYLFVYNTINMFLK